MIEVTAHYFAAFRERAGRESEPVQTESRTAGGLFSELSSRHGFLDARDRCKVAVNGEMSGWDRPLSEGDEVLFFPPVAGG
jgi:molybdopterin converting factor subunit 1